MHHIFSDCNMNHMTIKKILKMGNLALLQKASPINNFNTKALKNIIVDLLDSMHAHKGIGLSAPQIGISKRIIAFGVKDNPRYPHIEEIEEGILINPTYGSIDSKMDYALERCLSLPGLRGRVKRYTNIKIEGYDLHGNIISMKSDNFFARIIQHEIDHLDGILFPMRIENLQDFGYDEEITTRFTD